MNDLSFIKPTSLKEITHKKFKESEKSWSQICIKISICTEVESKSGTRVSGTNSSLVYCVYLTQKPLGKGMTPYLLLPSSRLD